MPHPFLRRIALRCTLAATLFAALAAVATEEDARARFVGALFTGVELYEDFARLETIFPAHRIAANEDAWALPAGAPLTLPASYRWQGEDRSVAALLDETRTSALLVLQGGRIRHEHYAHGGGPDVTWMSMSVAKSFVSAMVGIALEDGLIESVRDPITRYVPELIGSAYDGVEIEDVLQMSSGARWTEDYGDPDSDISRYGRVWATGASFDDFTATLERARPPGTYNYYNSTDTQALGMLLVRVTGRSLAAYAEETLWGPIGMGHDGWWLTDDEGMEMAAGGLQATARDYARFGRLYLQGGEREGRQIVPAQWIEESLSADEPHLQPAAHPDYPVGYGYQWWLPESERSEFAAIGVYNQFIWIDPSRDLVIVKLSANPSYGSADIENSWRELETFEFFRAVAAAAER